MVDQNLVPDNMGDFATKAEAFVRKAKDGGVSNIAIKNTIDMMHGLTKGKIEQRNRDRDFRLSQDKFEYGKSQDAISNQLAREKFDWQKSQDDRDSGSLPTNILDEVSSSGKSFLEEVTDDQGNFIDIIRQNPQLSQEEIVALAQANINKYGQFRESPEELSAMGLPVDYMAEMGMIQGVEPGDVGSDNALQYVLENYGSEYLTLGTGSERQEQAKAIAKQGLENYLQNAPTTELYSDKELEQLDKATQLKNQLGTIISGVSGQSGEAINAPGVGHLIGRFRPGFTLGKEGTELRQNITDVTAAKMKEISGAAISDKEVERLSKALPKIGDSEAVILEKTKNMIDALEIGQELSEIAKRERLTLDEAYQKYGAQAYSSRGQTVPSWITQDQEIQSQISGYEDLFEEVGI